MMDRLSSIAHIIVNESPVIASTLGGPLAGIVMSVITQAFGINSNDPQELVNKITSDVPKAKEILKSLECAHSEVLKKLLPPANNLESAEVNIKLYWTPHDSVALVNN